jgi:hypothetical protein
MSKRTLIAVGFVILFFLHQDFWWRDEPTLVLGILPVSLAYHVVWTLLVALGWFLVGRYCWPAEWDDESRPRAEAGDASEQTRRAR